MNLDASRSYQSAAELGDDEEDDDESYRATSPLFDAALTIVQDMADSIEQAANILSGASWALFIAEADPDLGQALCQALRAPSNPTLEARMIAECLPILRAAMRATR